MSQMTPSQPSILPVQAIVGDEPFLMRQAVADIVQATLGDDPSSMGPSRMEGESAELADVLDELNTYSLLGGLRLVIVEQADAFIKRFRKQLEKYCTTPASESCLVLVCKSMPANTKLCKIITASGKVTKCESIKPWHTAQWIAGRARDAYGKKMDSATAERLHDLAGQALDYLDNELGKLAVYVGSRPSISLEDVDSLVGQHREEVVFRVTDAMASGDLQGALKAWQHVLATDRAAPMRAVAGLASGIRRLLEARQAADAGVSPGGFGSRRDAMIERVNRTTSNSLKAQLCDLLQVDLATKTGLAEVGYAVESFLVRRTVVSR